MRRAGPFLLLATTGCMQGVALELPAVEGARSVFWVDEDTGRAAVYGADLRPPLALTDSPTTLRFYPWSPQSVGLAEGVIDPLPEPTQPLTEPMRVFEGNPGLGAPWQMRSHEGLLPLDVPSPDVESCFTNARTCVPREAPLRCEASCPEFEVAEPEPVVMPCEGAGWIAEGRQGATVCRPTSMPDLEPCAPGSLRDAPGGECQTFPCSDGPWPEGGEAPTVYVDPSQTPGGDGSAARPFSTLSAALLGVPDGGLILLTEGNYSGPLRLQGRAVTLRGVCPQRTVLTGGLEVGADGALTLQDLSMNAPTPALAVSSGALRLARVAMRGEGPLIDVEHASVQASRLRTISDGPPALTSSASAIVVAGWDHEGGAAARIEGGTFEVRQAVLRGDTQGNGIFLQDTESATVAQAWLREFDRAVRADGGALVFEDLSIARSQVGITVRAVEVEGEIMPPHARLARVLIEDAKSRGLELDDIDVDAEQVVVLDAPSFAVQFAQRTRRAARVTVRGLWVRSGGQAPIRVGPNSDLPIGNTLVVDGHDWLVEATRDETSQFGVLVRDAAELNLTRAVIVSGREVGLQVECGDGTLRDLVVIGGANFGLALQPQTHIRVERARVLETPATGVQIARVRSVCPFGRFEASDVALTGCPTCDRGLRLAQGAEGALRRIVVSGYGAGLEVEPQASMSLEDSAVRDNVVGIQLHPDHDVEPVVRGVQFEANDRNLVRGP